MIVFLGDYISKCYCYTCIVSSSLVLYLTGCTLLKVYVDTCIYTPCNNVCMQLKLLFETVELSGCVIFRGRIQRSRNIPQKAFSIVGFTNI